MKCPPVLHKTQLSHKFHHVSSFYIVLHLCLVKYFDRLLNYFSCPEKDFLISVMNLTPCLMPFRFAREYLKVWHSCYDFIELPAWFSAARIISSCKLRSPVVSLQKLEAFCRILSHSFLLFLRSFLGCMVYLSILLLVLDNIILLPRSGKYCDIIQEYCTCHFF